MRRVFMMYLGRKNYITREETSRGITSVLFLFYYAFTYWEQTATSTPPKRTLTALFGFFSYLYLSTGLSLADIAVGCALGYLSFRLGEMRWPEHYPNLAGLYQKLMQRPAFADTVPQV
jgi:glutathione S-transferase